MAFVIGVDVGGTNTDSVILCGNKVVSKAKTPTSEDKTQGVVNSIKSALDNLTEENRTNVLANLARVNIGTTHFTNAVKKRDGKSLDRVAVIRLCGSASRALPPFADFPKELKDLTFGGIHMINGGLEYNAKEIEPINPDEVRKCIEEILKQNPRVRNVVISGVFAPSDGGKQEKEVEEIVKAKCPELSSTLSHEIGMLGLIERENAAILNEALKTLAKVTINAFQEALSNLRIHCPFFLTQNDGTMISAEEAMQFPVLTFSSGPTNSMRGAAFLSGFSNAIVVDIGGTTTDVGVLKNGFPREASTHCKVGDVRTNFCMPDVQSIPLGGGSWVEYDTTNETVKIGPDSVEYRIKQEALCFGGKRCTTTDVAIASGVAPSSICSMPEAVFALSSRMVYAAMREIKKMLEAVIDTMKTEKEDVPVILVGGGCILVDSLVPLKGASRVILPADNWDVANAVGAALGTVGGASDLIVYLGPIRMELESREKEEHKSKDLEDKVKEASYLKELDNKARRIALERGRECARNEVINKKGAISSTVYIHSEEISDITYVQDRVRVRVKAIGALSVQDAITATPSSDKTLSDSRTKDGNMDQSVQLDVTQTSKDNPFWPNSSAEDRAKDEEANLPLPQVVGAEWTLTAHDIECLAIGAAILGCGGGGDPNNGRLRGLEMLRQGKDIKIINPCKVDPSKMGLFCGVAFMGAPVILVEKLVGGDEALLAFTRLQQLMASGVCEGGGKVGNERVTVIESTCSYFDGSSFPVYLAKDDDLKNIDVSKEDIQLDRRITGLICLEAGGLNSIEPLLLGAQTGLPVLDIDGMGRAFPELQMFIPFIYGARHYPLCLADNKGEVVAVTNVETSLEAEKCLRKETYRMGMSAAIAMGVMDFNTVLSNCILFTMSQAWQLGRAVSRARTTHNSMIDAVIEQQNGILLITGKVISVHRVSDVGFTKVVSTVEGLDEFAGYSVTIHGKNENYIAQSIGTKGEEGEILACTPDLISVIDVETGIPVTTEEIRYGLRVSVVVLPCNPILKTPRALKVVGPKAFGFDTPYREPRPLLSQKSKSKSKLMT